jgi:hypothetical protein
MEPVVSTLGMPSARDAAFLALLNAYRPQGGLSRIDVLPVGGCFRGYGQNRLGQDSLHNGNLFGFPRHNSF